jgi:internalin A
MRKFSLCFAFPDSQELFLVPDLLGKEEPEQAAHFNPKDCLNFEYHYEILPEGLIPKFIVRSQTLSDEQLRWRSGVILGREGSRALVSSNPTERMIVVRVHGGDQVARRELLAIVRYDVDRINFEFKDSLGVVAKVPLFENPAYAVDYTKLMAFERKGIEEFPEHIEDEVVMVEVAPLLHGVDVAELGTQDSDEFKQEPLVFFSYAHEDEWLRDQLETHLKLLQRKRLIRAWHDRKILPGGKWDQEIDRALQSASIILFLVSADFLASDYCWGKEVKLALKRNDATVIPIMLRDCDIKGAPFESLQFLPKDRKAVTKWDDRDSAWTDVAKGIRLAAEAMLNSPKV